MIYGLVYDKRHHKVMSFFICKTILMSGNIKKVGVKRLELSTPCTPCKCASQLRHTPNFLTAFFEQSIQRSLAEIGCKSTTFFRYGQNFFCINCFVFYAILIYSLLCVYFFDQRTSSRVHSRLELEPLMSMV